MRSQDRALHYSASRGNNMESGDTDFELVWLQKKDSLNIRCEHFLLLTFCHLKGNLFDCLLIDSNARHVLQRVSDFNYALHKTFNE